MTHETHARIAALVAAGFLMTSGGAAFADTATSGNGSIGGGNQVGADVDAPVNLCGNAVGLLGVAGANCTDSEASVEDGSEDEGTDGREEDEDASSTEAPQPPEEPAPDEEDPGEVDPGPDEDGEVPADPADPGDGGENPGEGGTDNGEEPAESDDEMRVPGETAEEQQAPGAEEQREAEPVTDASPAGTELADTGTERGPLVGLIAAAVGAVAVGAGLVFGLRRRTGA
ncbi:chaplin family protein [Nocardiopsis salina]|uniref:chaplin family protein n=1 Tax=Nocardiopsis salina TaxID=245836 RepID=UPI000348C421|nr:chaplin family protein [Nocardiopsis salina]